MGRLQVKKNAWVGDIDVNQMRFKSLLELSKPAFRFAQKIYVARSESLPKMKAIYGNAFIAIYIRKIAITVRGYQSKLIPALPQNRQCLGGQDLDASYVGPKQFGPK